MHVAVTKRWCFAGKEELARTGAKVVQDVGVVPTQSSVESGSTAQQLGAVRRKPGKGALFPVRWCSGLEGSGFGFTLNPKP